MMTHASKDILDMDICHLNAECALGNVPEDVYAFTIQYLNKYKVFLNG